MADRRANGANLGFENKLWEMADKLRGHMDAAEYKHVVLCLIFLKYISDVLQEKHQELEAKQETEFTGPEDRESIWPSTSFGCRRSALGGHPGPSTPAHHRSGDR